MATEIEESVRRRAGELGLEIASVGIRDMILPGEMKDLMNKVTEAKKAAEANLIARREETAAMRSQANTAKLLADNPTLMRLRELEVLEKIAAAASSHRPWREGPGRQSSTCCDRRRELRLHPWFERSNQGCVHRCRQAHARRDRRQQRGGESRGKCGGLLRSSWSSFLPTAKRFSSTPALASSASPS